MAKKFRFGVQAGTPTSASLGAQATATSEPRWAELARRAEDHGYDVVSLPDHLDGQLAPLVALAYVAAITDRIRLGVIVLANDFRNPAVLASEAATLDVLSGQRFELGLGAGWKIADYETAGIAIDPPGARIERLAATVARVRVALPSTVPIMLGGGGRKMLALAAREADIVSIVTENTTGVAVALGEDASASRVRERVDWVNETVRGRPVAPELHTRIFAAAGESSVADMPAHEAAGSPHVLVRPARVMADKLLRLRDEFGLSYFTVSERFIDEFAPVMEMLTLD